MLFRSTVPVLASVVVWMADAAEPVFCAANVSVAGVSDSAELMPVPLTDTNCVGDAGSSEAMVTVAVFAPIGAAGVNVTPMVQEAPGRTTVQPFARANDVASVPLNVAADTVRFAVPVLLTLMFCTADDVPVT